MNSWIAVSRTTHSGKHWRARTGFEFAADRQVVPVLVSELAQLLPHYVIGLTRSDDGSYQLVALVGLGGDRNLYVNKDSQWLANYVPAELRAYPFQFLNGTDGQKVFCIDESALSDDNEKPPLFNASGELDTLAARSLNFMTQCERSRQATAHAVGDLANAELIQQWTISINREEGGEPLKIEGLYKIDEQALKELKPERLASLRDSGALQIAYAQLFSMAQLSQLTQRAEYLAKVSASAAPPSGLENLFSNDDSGTLNFDALETGHKDN